MIEGLKPYPEYRPARVPWALVLPTHWGVERGKALFRRVVRPVRDEDEVVTCFRDGTVTLRKNRRTKGFTEAIKEHGYQGIRKGDLVIHAMDAFAGAAGVADTDGKGTPVYAACVPRSSANTFYYAHIVREMARQQWILALTRGIRERSSDFRFETFGTQDLPVPPPDEQAAIVRFLDHADRRIRRYIRAKQKLIKLLEEQKQAIIHEAVTRGLDPSVPMKDPRVEWLGAVPDSWSLVPLWTLARVRRELNPGGLGLLSVFLDRGVIPYAEGGGQVHAPSVDLSRYQVVRPGDFVLNNQQAWRGSVGVSSHHGIISPAYIVLAMSPGLDPTFANYLLRSRVMVDQFVVASRGVGDIQRQVYWPHLRSVLVPIPSLAEQQAIARRIEEQTDELTRTTDMVRRELDLVRELRTRLIADVVTGQLDVRAAAAALPDEPTDDEPLDESDEIDGAEDEAEAGPEDADA